MTREFYNENVRPLVKNGDIMLFRGKRLLAKTIQYFDSAKFNHVGVVFESAKRFFIIDSNARGVRPDFLSDRCIGYEEVSILRPHKHSSEEINLAIESIMGLADEKIRYDFLLLPRIAISRKLKIDLQRLGTDKRDICSEWTRRYAQALGVKCFDNGTWITPQDFLRLPCDELIKVL